MPSLPRATVLVLNYNGRHHLESCLPSLEALDYPHVSVTVIDNGSSDDSLEFVRRAHPHARLLPLHRNHGFAPAYNIAVAQTDADVVVLLNNDTRVERTWLSSLIETMEAHDAAAAASCMLDWDGGRIDFVGGLPTFVGHAWQVDHGRETGARYEARPLLFGCAGSLAIRRDAFQRVGGFDDDYFVYFEDLDLGWRMSLAGLPTVLAPDAITYHRLHGTARGWGHTLRLRVYERNALFTIFKNYGDEALARILPAAIALTLGRALASAGFDADAIRFGHPSPERMHLPPTVVATLLALEDFARALPRLREKRARVQASRRVADEALFALFPEPFKLHEAGDRYTEAARAFIRDFHIDALFDRAGIGGATAAVGVASMPAGGSGEIPAAHPSVVAASGRVSIVVLTASGARHLPECLDSLRQHAWPADRTEVIVVDNGSAHDPTEVAERHYPGVKVVRTGANLGFSGGNNAGARVATGDWIVFLNDDTRVAPDWLNELVGVAARRQASSVGAFIVDWPGEHVDFGGGLVNFEGRGFSIGYDRLVADADREERPLLFGCGAAVLFRRDVFEASGGWDEPTFAYYEDVEFGWRLWLLGHEVWFAPKAVVYHKHHGTSGSESPPRVRAFERNALRMVYALLEEATLRNVLPAALLLSADRVLLGTPFSRANDGIREARSMRALLRRLHPRTVKIRLLHALSQRGARRQHGVWTNLRRVGAGGLASALADLLRDIRGGWVSSGARTAYLIEETAPSSALEGHQESAPSTLVAQLLGIWDFLGMLPELSERRRWLQARRRRTDAEIVSRFGAHWLSAVPSPRLDLHQSLRDAMLEVIDVKPSGPASGATTATDPAGHAHQAG